MNLIMKKFEMPKFEMINISGLALAGVAGETSTSFEFYTPNTTYKSNGSSSYSRSQVLAQAVAEDMEAMGLTLSGNATT